ncbi:MAG: propionyl-CoA carboxylase, partial [Rickettsiaceae bacterium]|nr:propionyl-CoA carboxylase [Rickettsiaceae bacterium]
LITGIDLVEQMVRIAAAEKLSFSQEDIKLKGWAIEARICAEDPTRSFLPSSGRILNYKEPPKNANIRVDSGVESGGEISMFYDPMIAKLCVYDENRAKAIEHMKSALSLFVLQGISHNISFLEALISHKRFIEGDIHTGFIEEEYPDGFSGAKLTSEITKVFLATAIFAYITEQKRASSVTGQIDDQSHKIGTRWVVNIDNGQFPVIIKPVEDGFNIRYSNNRIYVRSNWSLGSHLFLALVNGQKVNVKIENIITGYKLTHSGITVDAYVRSPRISELESLMSAKEDYDDQNELPAPLAGQIIGINVKEGEEVTEGQELLILTAMKMENIITASRTGKIAKILVTEQENVSSGQVLLEFE